MSIIKILDTRELEEFAKGLADDLARRFPPASESRTDPGANHQIKVILEELAARAGRYRLRESGSRPSIIGPALRRLEARYSLIPIVDFHHFDALHLSGVLAHQSLSSGGRMGDRIALDEVRRYWGKKNIPQQWYSKK